MLQARTMCLMALLGLTATAANASDRYSSPQVRLGVDVIWGGYGYDYAPPPPVVYYPAYYQSYPVYYEPYPVYDRGHSHGRDKRHRKHNKHRRHHDDD